MAAILTILITILALMFFVSEQSAEEEAIAIGVAVVIVLVLMPIAELAWNFAVAPFRLELEGGPSSIAGITADLSKETKNVLVDQGRRFRHGRVRESHNLKSEVLEELRRFGILESKTVDNGWWSRDRHKGWSEYYYLTRIGEQVLDSLSQETSSE